MSLFDRCIFLAAGAGTGDFVVVSAVTGYQLPIAANVQNGNTSSYAAQSSDLTQWEVGRGTYSTSGPTLARTTVLFNSLGTTAKINFTAAPQVELTLLAEDLTNPVGASNDYCFQVYGDG